MRRIGLSSTVMGNVLLALQCDDDYTSFILKPEEANKLAYRLMSYAAGGGGNHETVISEGENK